MSMPAFRSLGVFALAVVAVSACKSKPAPPPAPVQPPATVAPPPRVNQDSIDRARAAAAEAERLRLAAEEARRNAGAIAEMRAALTKTIYFDYDKDEIRADQRAALDAKVPILTGNPGLRIRIAGHTDSRGSDEYNLALGQRRSASAKRYLVSRGIAEGRIDVVSFGEERPAAQGENEDAWGKNRRDEFEITAGGDNLKVVR
jgi:peptidoglycan-associated lipoprotein